MNAEDKTWIFGRCSSDGESISFERVFGTEDQIRTYILAKINEDKKDNIDIYDYGTEFVEDVEKRNDGSLYAYSVYCDHHIDYSAVLEYSIKCAGFQEEGEQNTLEGKWIRELVRCKDCRHHEKEYDQPGMVYCYEIVGGWVDDNWFCSKGERSKYVHRS